MSDASLEGRIFSRAEAAGIGLDSQVAVDCAAYVALLAKWNRRVNLTALQLADPIPDTSVDKLVVEPLIAAALFPPGEPRWIDLGSGGGSPALPLRISRPAGSLRMVESRERKCAFLREAVRALGLRRTEATASRFQDLGTSRTADLITVRAVRVDGAFLDVLDGLLATYGQVLSFGSPVQDPRFRTADERLLPDGSTLFLVVRAPV